MEEIDSLDIFAAYKYSRPIHLEHNTYELDIEEGELLDLNDLPQMSRIIDKYNKV